MRWLNLADDGRWISGAAPGDGAVVDLAEACRSAGDQIVCEIDRIGALRTKIGRQP